ncbi:MAG: hypothetical protein IKW21_05705 [Lachnospiraceae bacterium]|nr:hypothetical protein [Lachnospiraceae bacterium]
MTKEQIMIFDAKLEKMVDHHYEIVYFEGFKDCIQFMENNVFHDAEQDAYKMNDHTMRYPFTRLLFNMKDALQKKLVDELFRRMDELFRMDKTIEGYKKIMEESTDDYDIPDPEWMECDDDCASCSSDTCNHRTEEYQVVDDIYDLPDSSIDFMGIGGNDEDD